MDIEDSPKIHTPEIRSFVEDLIHELSHITKSVGITWIAIV